MTLRSVLISSIHARLLGTHPDFIRSVLECSMSKAPQDENSLWGAVTRLERTSDLTCTKASPEEPPQVSPAGGMNREHPEHQHKLWTVSDFSMIDTHPSTHRWLQTGPAFSGLYTTALFCFCGLGLSVGSGGECGEGRPRTQSSRPHPLAAALAHTADAEQAWRAWVPRLVCSYP